LGRPEETALVFLPILIPLPPPFSVRGSKCVISLSEHVNGPCALLTGGYESRSSSSSGSCPLLNENIGLQLHFAEEEKKKENDEFGRGQKREYHVITCSIVPAAVPISL
jgi:hypothetical protein